jgi:hypothetical protein
MPLASILPRKRARCLKLLLRSKADVVVCLILLRSNTNALCGLLQPRAASWQQHALRARVMMYGVQG